MTITIALGVVGVAALITLSRFDLLPYHQYQSVTTVRLQGGSADQVGQLTSDVLSRASLSAVINDPHLSLYKDQLQTTPLEDVIRTMTRNIKISLAGDRGGAVFNISFDYPDRYKAQETVLTLIERIRAADSKSFPNAAPQPATMGMVLDVLDTASLPVSPAKPNRYMITLLGGLIGLAIASAVTLLRRRWHPEPDFPVDAIQE